MRDIKVVQPESKDEGWDLDINIVDGEPEWLERAEESSGQRSALAAYTAKGSIPGMLDVGIQWSDFFEENTVEGFVSIDNQMKQAVSDYGTSQIPEDGNKVYTPFAIVGEDGSLSVSVFKS